MQLQGTGYFLPSTLILCRRQLCIIRWRPTGTGSCRLRHQVTSFPTIQIFFASRNSMFFSSRNSTRVVARPFSRVLARVAIDTSCIINTPTHHDTSLTHPPPSLPGVIVVPSFEADQNQSPPATKAELDACMSAKSCRGVLEVRSAHSHCIA